MASFTLVDVAVVKGRETEFADRSKTNFLASRKEAGNLRFDVLQSRDDPAKFVLVEIYGSPDDVKAHKETVHYLEWREGVADMMATPRKGVQCTCHFPSEPSALLGFWNTEPCGWLPGAMDLTLETASSCSWHLSYCGMAFTLFFFLSPAATCLQIVKEKDAQQYSPLPYIVAVFNCSLWVYYCVITMETTNQDLTPNGLINAAGALLEICYVLVFIRYSRERASVIYQALVAVGLFWTCILFFEVVLPLLPDWNKHWDFHWGGADVPLKSSLCGVVTDVLNVALYGSPLVVMGTVIRTRSVKYMPLPLS
ncbi:unnamed protein product, partial [Polarella glacialis]